MAQTQQITPAQRAELFAVHTRQHIQELPTLVGLGPNRTVNFTLPKVRLLAKISLLVEGTLNVGVAAATGLVRHSPYNLLRRVQIGINNGFNPVSLSGAETFITNLAKHNGNNVRVGSERTLAPGLTVGAHPFRFTADYQVSLNERDAIGLVLLQNEETVVTVTVDIGDLTTLVVPGGTTTLDVTNLRITPIVETFSIPAIAQAFPDISILKLQQSQINEAPVSGVMTVRLPVGTTYRKIFIDSGLMALNTTFNIILNQADTPYNINSTFLRARNEEMYGGALPANVFAFDFSYQGIASMGGLRDYIDTERLTEFWIRFNVPVGAAGRQVTTIFETLSRLRPSM